MTHDLWSSLNQKMLEYLGSVSLQCLVDKHRQKDAEKDAGKTIQFRDRPVGLNTAAQA